MTRNYLKFNETTTPGSRDAIVDRSPFFYGWITLFAGTMGMIAQSPGQDFVLQGFVEHFIRDLDVSRSAISALFTVSTLAGAVLLPLVGRIVDRHGPRKLILMISLLLGGACIVTASANSFAMLSLGFFGLRFLGPQAMALVSSTMINQWWVRHRGKVLGFSGSIASFLSMAVLPSLLALLIHTRGWRMTYVLLAILPGVIMAPLGYLFFRARPEKYGLQPDGECDAVPGVQNSPNGETHYTLPEALRTSTFWLISLSLSIAAMFKSGLTFHMQSIIQERGLPESLAAAVFIPVGTTCALLRFPFGALADRYSPRTILVWALMVLTAMSWFITYIESSTAAYIYGIALGILNVSLGATHSVALAYYFGRLHLGAISGVGGVVVATGLALGPLPLALSRDLLGSYTPILRWGSALPMVLVIPLLLFVRRGKHTFN